MLVDTGTRKLLIAMSNPLAKMIGPLPAGAWLGVVGGGLALAFIANRNKTPAPVIAPQVPDVGDFPIATPGGGGTPDGTAPKPTTNDEWARYVANVLIGRGFDPVLVQQALDNFLHGHCVNAAQKAVVEIALVVMQPPMPPPALTLCDDQPGGPPVPGGTPQYARTTPGDSMRVFCQRELGNGNLAPLVLTANHDTIQTAADAYRLEHAEYPHVIGPDTVLPTPGGNGLLLEVHR